MAINYNKLMEELDNCLGLESSATESVKKPQRSLSKSKAPLSRKAFEGYDDIEVQLATELGQAPDFTEDDLVFADEEGSIDIEGDGTVDSEDLTDGELTDEGLFRESFRKLFERLTHEGSSVDEAREIIMNLIEDSFVEYFGEEEIEIPEEVEDIEIEESEEEEVAEESTIVTPVEEVSPHTIETKAVEDKEALGDEDEDPEAAFEALSSKMLSRYQALAEKTKSPKNSATESKNERKAAIDELALARTSAEYGYSGQNLRKMVVEAIEKGVI